MVAEIPLPVDVETSRLLQRAIDALVAADMDEALDLVTQRVFTHGRALTVGLNADGWVLVMRPYTELLLLELIDLAHQPGLPDGRRAEAAREAVRLAGFL